MKKAVLYSAVLIGVYLAVSHATAAGRVLVAAGGAPVPAIKALQGR